MQTTWLVVVWLFRQCRLPILVGLLLGLLFIHLGYKEVAIVSVYWHRQIEVKDRYWAAESGANPPASARILRSYRQWRGPELIGIIFDYEVPYYQATGVYETWAYDQSPYWPPVADQPNVNESRVQVCTERYLFILAAADGSIYCYEPTHDEWTTADVGDQLYLPTNQLIPASGDYRLPHQR